MKTGFLSRLGSAFAVGLKSFSATAASWRRGDDMIDGAAAHLTRPYGQSGAVFAAVNLISGEFTGLPVKFYQGDNEYSDATFDAWWSRPALGHDKKPLTRAEVDRWLALWLLLEGECFILLDDAWAISAGRARARMTPFIIARPDRIRLIVQSGELMGYAYTDAAGRQSVYVPEQVIHKKEPNPYDDWRGLGRAQVAAVPTESTFLTGVYIRELMRNNGDQGMVVIAKSGVVQGPQRDQIIADLKAKRAALRRGVARDLFLTGDITVDRKEEQAAGIDLTNTQTLSMQEIFLTFLVPPSMATVKQSYSIGKDSDRYQLITGNSQPLARVICGAYAELATRQTGKELTAEHDWDDHPVMQEVRNSRIEAALKLWGAGWPWEKINDYLDLGAQEFPGWDVGYLPFSVSPVDGGATPALPPATDPALAEPKALDPALVQLRALVLTRSRVCKNVTPSGSECRASVLQTPSSENFSAFACACHGTTGIEMKGRSEKEIAQWKTLMAQRRATVKSFQSALGRVLMQARVETLKKIAALPADKKIEAKSGLPDVALAKSGAAADLLFDLAKFALAFGNAMENQQKAALQTAGDQLFAELQRDDVFKLPPAEVIAYLRARKNKLSDVPQEMYDRLKASLEEGINAGETSAQLAGRAKQIFNDITDGQARTIALNETSAVYGAGRHQAMQQAGVQWKQWLTSGNANVRAAHAEANGQTVAIDESFIVDGEALDFPGDDAGSPGNVINCHCVSIAVASGPADTSA